MQQEETNSLIDLQLLQHLVVGIGEVSEITDIPQRKLRYWEERGIIQSIAGDKGSTRRYNYLNIKKLILIKDMLDSGYTLEAANRLVTQRMETINEAFQKLVTAAVRNEEEIPEDQEA